MSKGWLLHCIHGVCLSIYLEKCSFSSSTPYPVAGSKRHELQSRIPDGFILSSVQASWSQAGSVIPGIKVPSAITMTMLSLTGRPCLCPQGDNSSYFTSNYTEQLLKGA